MKKLMMFAVLFAGCFCVPSVVADEMACMEAAAYLADAQDNLQYWTECITTANNHVNTAHEQWGFYLNLREEQQEILEQAQLALQTYLENHPNDADPTVVAQLEAAVDDHQFVFDSYADLTQAYYNERENWISITLSAQSEETYWQNQVAANQALVTTLGCTC